MKKSKKLLIFVLALASLICLFVFGASAETVSGTCGSNLTWTYDTETCVLDISGTGKMSNYSYYFSAKAPWNGYLESIKTVTISDGVTSIGDDAFHDCSSLISVKIGNSVQSIGNSAFYNCSSLTSITIPDCVTSIGRSAFENCSGLTNITIPDSVTSIGHGAFYNCTGLVSIKTPNIDVFGSNSTNLKSVEITRSIYIKKEYSSQLRLQGDLIFSESVDKVEQEKGAFLGNPLCYVTFKNPNCIIDIEENDSLDNCYTVIKGYEGSTAEEYAKKHNRLFVTLIDCNNDCEHLNTEVINKTEATEFKDGYSGDIYCVDCQNVVEKGFTEHYFINVYEFRIEEKEIVDFETDEYVVNHCASTNPFAPFGFECKNCGIFMDYQSEHNNYFWGDAHENASIDDYYNICEALYTDSFEELTGYSKEDYEQSLEQTIKDYVADFGLVWEREVKIDFTSPKSTYRDVFRLMYEHAHYPWNYAFEKEITFDSNIESIPIDVHPGDYQEVLNELLDYACNVTENWETDPETGNKLLTVSRSCPYCDKTETRGPLVIEKHEHDYLISEKKEATCTTNGKIEYVCSCGEKYEEIITATGHAESDWIIDKAPTCTEPGSKHTVCSVCGITMSTQDIKATGHDYVTYVTYPTCSSDGYTTHTCSVCGNNYQDSFVEQIGHHDDNNDGLCDDCEKVMEGHNPSENCTCMCHKTGIMQFIYKIVRIFWKIFGTNKTCNCGVAHY